MTKVNRILETALYVDDMTANVAFYQQLFGCTPLLTGARLTALDAGGGTVLLLFQKGETAQGLSFEGGSIPPHEGGGASHVAFAITVDSYEPWKSKLQEAGVPIESEVRWSRGGKSMYVRDPEGHSVELATPGVWAIY